MRLKRRLFYTLILQLFVAKLFGFDISDRFIDAHAAAQGYAMSGRPLTTAAAYWNPAGVALSNQEACGVSYLNKFQLMNVVNVDYLYPDVASDVVYSLNFLYQEVPNIEKTIDIGGEGRVVGSFSDKQTVMNVSLASEISKDFYLGASFKGIFHQIDDFSGSGIAADFGIIRSLDDNLFLGITFKNVLSVITWESDLAESYDKIVVVGLAVSEFPGLERLALYLDIDSGTADNGIYFGGEYALVPDAFFLRAGANTLAEITMGFGLKSAEFIFDFAFVFNERIENSILFSFGYLLNDQKVRKYYQSDEISHDTGATATDWFD